MDQIDALHHLAAAAPGNEELTNEAIRHYEAAIKHSPKNQALRQEFSQSLFLLDRPDMAVDICDKALQTAPGNTAAIANKIICLLKLGRHDDVRYLADGDRFIRPMRLTDVPGYASAASFNEALAAHAASHPTLNFTLPEKSTRFGGHTGELRFGSPRTPIDALEAVIGKAVMEYRDAMPKDPAHPFLANFPDRWGLTIWAIIMGSQGHQTPHIHPAGWLSGVYYPKVSAVVAEPGTDNAGWIEFGCPPDIHAKSVEPELSLYRPEEGLMLLFPSYIYHRTIPYQTDETRISVAFDIFPLRRAEGTNRPNLAKIVAPNSLLHPI